MGAPEGLGGADRAAPSRRARTGIRDQTSKTGSDVKIVHVITRFIRGGADENTLLTCNGQAEMGHDVTLIHGGEFHESMVARLSANVRCICVPALVRPVHPLKDVLTFANLTNTLRRIRPDIVHTHESKAGVIGRMAARIAGVPINVHGVHILAFVHTRFPLSTIYRYIERFVGTMTDAFIDVSGAMCETALAARIGRREQHFVVESGMQVEVFQNATALDWRKDPQLRDLQIDKPRFLLLSGTLEISPIRSS